MSGSWMLAVVGAALLACVAALVLFTYWNTRRAERLAPAIGRFIEIDGARLHYQDRGQGPAIVLVHGLGGNLRNFYRLVEALSDTHRVIAVDRPGSGYSTAAPGVHPGLHGQAALVARFIHRLALDRPVLVGHSLGGALALALALDHPGSVRALVLVAPLTQVLHSPPESLRTLDLRKPWLRWLVAWLVVAPFGRLSQRRILDTVYAPEAAPPGFQVDGGGVLGLRPHAFIHACRDMLQVAAEMHAMPPRYASLDLPVVVVFGRQDPVLDPRTHGERFAAAVPAARLHLIDGGHMIPITAVETVARHIRTAITRP